MLFSIFVYFLLLMLLPHTGDIFCFVLFYFYYKFVFFSCFICLGVGGGGEGNSQLNWLTCCKRQKVSNKHDAVLEVIDRQAILQQI